MSQSSASQFEPSEGDPAADLAAALGLSDMATERLKAAIASTGQPPAVAASLLGLATEDRIAAASADLHATPLWTGQAPESAPTDTGVNPRFLQERYAVLLSSAGEARAVGLVDPGDSDARDGLTFALGGEVRFHTIPLSVWKRSQASEAAAGPAPVEARAAVVASWADDAERLRDFTRDTPIVRLADDLFERAFLAGASDVHVEQKSDHARVRFRIDGVLREVDRLAPAFGPALIARTKVLCDLDVAACRTPQDGRTTLSLRGAPVDVRVSTTPTAYGESLVVRLLHRRGVEFSLDRLGLSADVRDRLNDMLGRRHGLILVTGPTGSGKTTTLYAALRRLTAESLKILTVEDPVEYVFEDINQTQVNEAAGVTFASALRSFLRHDPDVILVGEIRDAETARLAVQASLTGHLVLATLHTNDSLSAVARLADMGVEPYLLAGVLIGAVAQRLAPKLCAECARPAELSDADRGRLAAIGVEAVGAAPREAHGCAACGGSGRAGRVPVTEAFVVDDQIERLIVEGAPTGDLRQAVARTGFRSFEHDAVHRALAGEIAMADAWRTFGR